MSLHRRLILHWPLLMAGVFSAFTLALLWTLHGSQVQLRAATDARLAADSQRRAAAIADFIADREGATIELAGSHEIEAYMANRALGMSAQYGLNAMLSLVDQRFAQQIEQKTLRGVPIYDRIAFRDVDGVCLSDVGNDQHGSLLPAASAHVPKVVMDAKTFHLIAVAPVIHKGVLGGTVVTITDLRQLSRLLISSGATEAADVKYHEFLISDDGNSIPGSEAPIALAADLGRIFARLPENTVVAVADIPGAEELGRLLVLRTAVAGVPLSTITLMAETEAYGELAPRAYSLYLGAFALALLLAAAAFERMRQRALRLEEEYSESHRHRTELKQRNEALSTEISRREAVEAVLNEKTQALDKLNAELRIAAAAFDSQEGMVVADADNVILRTNHAFTRMSGYPEGEIVGQPWRLPRSGHGDSDLVGEMRETVLRTGGWQGEVWDRTKTGDLYTRWLTISAVKDEAGAVTHYIGTYYDVSERKRAEERIKELAFYDQLTGLPNRTLLLDRMRQAISANGRTGSYGALLFIDLDSFKTLNDTLGHDMGDLLLKEVARRLTASVRQEDTVARFGGDEFVVLLENLSRQDRDAAIRAESVGDKILSALAKVYQLASYEHLNTASIGVALLDDRQQSIDELLKRADLAMYEAKAAGRNTLRFFDPGMQTVVNARAALEGDLREAMRKDQFALYYQPQMDDQGRMTGAEALLRWPHPQRGFISPAEFIPLAENTGLIRPLGNWIMETACRQLAAWAARPETAHLTLAVNVSAMQLHRKDFVEHVLAQIEHVGANPYRLKLELTESLLINNIEEVIDKMTALKQRGIRFSLDDFGTGYSSLAYLKRLPLDELKIDQGFVRDILIDPNDAAIARMIVVLGASLGLTVIAEGVETELQRKALKRHGCRAYQGYLFSKPLSSTELEAYARSVARGKKPAAPLPAGELAAVG
jgi:diguanylate cyclase (GGDEF)-like protein/PAS domain S-box-containing protein